MNRLTALLMLLLSASPFTAPFSTVSGPPLSVSATTAVGASDGAGIPIPSDEHSQAFCVPSLPDGARAILSDALTGHVNSTELSQSAAMVAALGAAPRAHVLDGLVALSPPPASISILRI